MLFLAESHGRLPVGATTFKFPVSTKVLGTTKIRGHGGRLNPALQLEEVVFTAYYPADVKGNNIKKGLDWLLRPLRASLHGYARYAGVSPWFLWPIVYLYGTLLKIPVYSNAPLLRQRPTPSHGYTRSESQPWPLVIFSHGLGGSRTAYSQLCTRLASSGRVVLAVQHRDGSGHAFIPSTTGLGLYVKEKDLIWTSDDENTMDKFREQQLAFRRHEIYLAFRSFKQLVQDGYQGSSHGLQTIDDKTIDWSSWTSGDDSKAVECDKDVLLAGHSFGGATVATKQFTILSTDPPADVSAPIPVHKALILDPWLEPIPSPGPCPPPQGPGDALPQLLVINSERFSLWKDHFTRLIDVVQAWEPEKRRVLTILRSQHDSFSDFPLLPLVSRRAARIVMDRIMELSEAFIDGDVDTFVDETATRKMEIRKIGKKPDGSPQRQFVGESDPAASDTSIPLFKSIGLSQAKAAEAAKNAKSANVLHNLIVSYDLTKAHLDEKQATLVTALAGQLAKTESIEPSEQDFAVKAILQGKLKSVDQVNAAVKYLETHNAPINELEFDTECGVGFSITSEELFNTVTSYIRENAVTGWPYLGSVISGVKASPALRWANPLEIKNAVEKAFTETFGVKEAAKPKAKEPKKEKAPQPTATASETGAGSSSSNRKPVFEEGFLGALHKPGENPQNSPELREQHLRATDGQVWTRFPPEPNGYLHIGHSKAIFVNFGYAAHHGGKCYLRFDDTNPEKEEARYFESIIEVVRWLGFEPWKITYSSDYFDQLYELAIELIKRDKAYVCHCTQEQIKADRGEKVSAPKACVHRSRPIQESLDEFKKMADGYYRPKEANLRMKMDLTDGNPQMWDLTAYRILDADHHRTKDKWKIYPTYDYTHCLVDSFENISHSLCTTEFIASRQSYEWLCDALDVYKPRQSEFGRLNLQGTINSKRKILQLVDEGYVSGWDDPRLYTLIALRRRGVPPGAILSFVSTLGVSTAASNIQIARFEQTVRQYLEGSAPRLFMVMRPLKVVIENVPDDYLVMVDKPFHPKNPQLGSSQIPFTRTIYIDADDFRLEDSKDYFRLAPGKSVGLFQAPYPITCTSYKTDSTTGEVTEVFCRLEDSGSPPKPKAYIQWVAEHAPSGSPVRIDETRIFHPLFESDNPLAAVPDFRADINPNSMEVVKGAMVEVSFWPLAKRSIADALEEARARSAKAKAIQGAGSRDADTPEVTPEQLVGKECVRFQGLRVAYLAVDADSRLGALEEPSDVTPGIRQGDYLVLNRIASLKEDAGKGM
ncbi:tRNA synthetases class I, catalytic domain-containing protein [Suillus clintonianus]|uniref:tRNA synthetases class I, catalytic domain-containing protein n=1 Tax=Suillus clintonianus TaxID=1904413 RepID=UPI001B86CA52|nr:tRNA synthetases class I, catalytic domain-containing protein [Suillus clintonianus]KAG2156227.1 tRNA synthetases class I, catalytic domain-containing protein [Suillus clintonianus]